MKTRHFFLATIFLTLFVLNGYGHSFLKITFAGKKNKTETPDRQQLTEKPDCHDTVFVKVTVKPQAEEKQDLYMQQFDISTMSKPEAEVDDWGIDTRAIFQMIMLEGNTRKY